jgi:uncharacterized protein (UPF0333 family)
LVFLFDRANAELTDADQGKIPPPKITVCPEIYNAGEETLYLEGVAEPNLNILIYLKSGEEIAGKWQIASSGEGRWVFYTKDLVRPGNYYLTAQSQTNNLSSGFSNQCQVRINLRGLAFGNFLLSFKYLSIIAGFILLFFIITAFYFAIRKRNARNKLKKEIAEVRIAMSQAFSALDKQTEKRIELFDEQAGFNTQERQIYNDSKNYINNARASIEKEVGDIENVIK